MSNNALIITEKRDLAVYVHNLGSQGYIEAFLEVCKQAKFRSPETDSYGWARLCQGICNYHDVKASNAYRPGLGCGIDIFKPGDYDNGIYIIKDWEIIGREGNRREKISPTKEEVLEDVFGFTDDEGSF